jgi:hypothetical protein
MQVKHPVSPELLALLCCDHLAPGGLYFVRIGQLQDTLAAAELKLSETEIKQLDEMF